MPPNPSPQATVVTSDGPVPYKLVFGTRDSYSLFGLRPRRVLSGRAKLSSPLLDVAMHHGTTLIVMFESIRCLRHRDPQPSVDPFELDSVAGYLAAQGLVRGVLERELDQGPEVWNKVTVSELYVRPREVRTCEDFERFRRFGQRVIDSMYAASDKPDTRTRFFVTLEGDWEDGHYRSADFRDGQLIEFRTDG